MTFYTSIAANEYSELESGAYQVGESIGEALGKAIIYSFLFLLILFVFIVVVLRWIFRINTIVNLLQKIAINNERPKNNLTSIPPKKIVKKTCDACGKDFDISQLTKLAIGKTVCPSCKKTIKSL